MNFPYWVGHHAAGTPDRVALEDLGTGRVLTYGELDRRARSLAAHLRNEVGVSAGDRVAVLSPNSSNVVEVQEACRLLGAVFLPLNVRLTAEELGFIVGDAVPRILLFASELAALADPVAAGAGVRTLAWGGPADSYEAALAAAGQLLEPYQAAPEDPLTLIYTSGTTGRPKGAVTSFESALAVVLNSLVAGGIGPTSVNLTILPLFHVAGLNLFLNATLYAGGRTVIASRFEPQECLDLLTDDSRGITHIVGVPATYQFMSRLDGFSGARFGGLFAGVGGSPSASALFETWRERDVELRNIYGITEGSSTVCVMPPGRGRDKSGSVGRPVLHARLRIVGADGEVLAPGEVGELQVSGPNVGPGYWRRDEATAETFVDGWLRTGDAARLDDEGFCFIVDRWKDMYISGGENVYPTEVENVLYQLQDVAEVAVVGVPDEKWGETGLAAVVPRPGASLTEREVIDFCRTRLARYKAPTQVRFVDELPRNAVGKIRKVDLRDRFADD
ncbi:acyl-CoA synthetase [Modestobacter lapidis]|nr:long-chain fatty acid--CoA ligase [Modestobacter lapidis]